MSVSAPLADRSFSLAARLRRLKRLGVAIFTIVTMIAIFTSFAPRMPRSGLDPSWIFAMNEAMAQGLAIGRDIIYTVGPYAAIYTREYHPATDRAMIAGGLILGLCYAFALLYVTRNSRPWLLLALLLFFAGGRLPRDALLLSYPLLIAVAAIRFTDEAGPAAVAAPDGRRLVSAALLMAPLGLLPLIKGSLLLICTGIVLVLCVLLSYHRHYLLALALAGGTIIWSLLFWVLSGQALGGFTAYFASMLPIVSGYTEAMAYFHGLKSAIEPLLFLLAAAAILWTLLRASILSAFTRGLLTACFTLFIFVSFKAGFVRHDAHALIAVSSLVVAAWLLGILVPGRRFVPALLLALLAWGLTYYNYNAALPNIPAAVGNTYERAWVGLRARATGEAQLNKQFDRAVAAIRQKSSIPELQGTTDIYSYGQSYLIASGNHWNSRPIFQSYSAYTPVLARINARHLRQAGGPDNVLFRLETIDERLPALDDGLSWPALIDNYRIDDWNGDYVTMVRRTRRLDQSTFRTLGQFTGRIGEFLALPSDTGPIFADIDLAPTLIGKLLTFAFKPPQLTMRLRLANGDEQRYRVIANMMRSGFFLSPLIARTSDFVLLATGNLAALEPNQVTAMAITPSYGGRPFWADTFKVTLGRYEYDTVDPVLVPVRNRHGAR